MPLIAQGRLQGVVELFHRSPLRVDAEWASFLEMFATQIAIAVESAGRFDQLQRSHMELGTAYDTPIKGWSRALDLKDEETEGRSRRVTQFVIRLAKHIGMSEEDLVRVRQRA